jgi:hypothetical protein
LSSSAAQWGRRGRAQMHAASGRAPSAGDDGLPKSSGCRRRGSCSGVYAARHRRRIHQEAAGQLRVRGSHVDDFLDGRRQQPQGARQLPAPLAVIHCLQCPQGDDCKGWVEGSGHAGGCREHTGGAQGPAGRSLRAAGPCCVQVVAPARSRKRRRVAALLLVHAARACYQWIRSCHGDDRPYGACGCSVRASGDAACSWLQPAPSAQSASLGASRRPGQCGSARASALQRCPQPQSQAATCPPPRSPATPSITGFDTIMSILILRRLVAGPQDQKLC